jgi:hypothetical protein
MRGFKIAVYESGGLWFFRWWNAGYPNVQSLGGPFGHREEADAAEQRFMNEEQRKYPWSEFESAS